MRVALLLPARAVRGELHDVLREVAFDARGSVAGEVLQIGLQRRRAANGFVDVVEGEGERRVRLQNGEHRLDLLEDAAPGLRRERAAPRRAAQLRGDAVRQHAQLVLHAQRLREGQQLGEALENQRGTCE